MKINRQILSIPPHISTSWNNISSLHVTEEDGQTLLVITLMNHSVINIPNLNLATIEEIFNMHSKFLEQETHSQEATKPATSKSSHPFAFGGDSSITFGLPLKMGEGDMLNSFGGLLQHSQEQSNSPALPQEMLKKITAISKAMGLDKQLESMPKAEPHCNCPYCQVARALLEEQPHEPKEVKITEEQVEDSELKFREWDIQEIGKHLYEISNPFDPVERYQVFLGKPIGCTCGSKNCEHIKAVLNS